jgi:hypothetical protein
MACYYMTFTLIEGKKPLGRPKRRTMDITKLICCKWDEAMEWIH